MSMKWKVGDKLRHERHGTATVCNSDVERQELIERGGWKLVEPAAPPTAATERKFAPGWTTHFVKGGHPCSLCKQRGPYGTGDGRHMSSCDAHASVLGVFADSPPQPVPDAAMRDLLWGKRKSGDGDEDMIAMQIQDALAYRASLAPKPVVTKWVAAKPVAPPRCATCTHVHAGPCNGSSPNGEFACPCGHPKTMAKRERVNVVGTYNVYEPRETFYGKLTKTGDRLHGATATLMANLARENPPGCRPIRTVARYEGNSDD